MGTAPATPAIIATPRMTKSTLHRPVTGPARVPHRAGDMAYAQALFESGKSVAEISRDIGVADTILYREANQKGWLRDPLAVARLEQERKELMAREVADRKSEIVAITARQQSEVLVRHRQDIAKARQVVSLLLDEVTRVSSQTELFEHLGELMHEPNERGVDKLNAAYKRVISIPERSMTVNTLATALKTLIMLERQAFDIAGPLEDPEASRPQTEVVKGLDKIMDKFNEVLALQVQKDPVEVIDVSRPHQASTAVSTV